MDSLLFFVVFSISQWINKWAFYWSNTVPKSKYYSQAVEAIKFETGRDSRTMWRKSGSAPAEETLPMWIHSVWLTIKNWPFETMCIYRRSEEVALTPKVPSSPDFPPSEKVSPHKRKWRDQRVFFQVKAHHTHKSEFSLYLLLLRYTFLIRSLSGEISNTEGNKN